MKKATILLSIVMYLSCSLIAQVKSTKVDIEWGPEQKESKKSTLADIIGYDETGFYALKTQIKNLGFSALITLEHFNNELGKTKSVEIELKEKKYDKKLEGLYLLNNKLYLLTSLKDKKTKINKLYVETIDKQTLLLNGDSKEIATIDYANHRKFNAGTFNYKLSRDSSKVLIYYNLPYEKGASEKFGFQVYDNELNKLWEKEIELPYKEELFEVENYRVANDGNVYLLGVIFKDKRRVKRHGEPNYKYQVLSYTDKGNKLTEYPIEVEDHFLTDMIITINEDKDIVCGGFYSAKGTFTVKGSYFLKIDDETKEIKAKSFNEFGIDFITQNMTERQEKKSNKKAEKGKKPELYKYFLDEIILKDNGGAVLIGEQFYIVSVARTYTNPNGGITTTYTNHYYYNDIIVVNMGADGNIVWTEKIPKRQVSVNDGGFFSSYTITVVNDKMYFVFNDNPKNLEYTGEGKIYNFNRGRESLVVLVELDKNGNQTREAIFSAKEAEVLIRPKVCEQISNTELILFGQKKKAHKFARVTFKNN